MKHEKVQKLQTLIILFSVMISIILIAGMVSAAEVTLAWDANTESDLAGYRLYYGLSSGVYGDPVDVGNVTEYTLTGITPNVDVYYAATAYDTSGNESGYSEELVHIIDTESPAPPTGLRLWIQQIISWLKSHLGGLWAS